MRVLLCGGGNAIHVLTSYIGSKPECEVVVWSMHEDEAEHLESALCQSNGVRCVNDLGDDVVGKPVRVSKEAKDVVPGSNVIILSLPAFAHDTYLKAMAPFIEKAGVVIGALPAEGGFDMCVRNAFGSELADSCIIFATETLPWACRIEMYGKTVEVLGTKKQIDMSVSPLKETENVIKMLNHLIGQTPEIESAGSFLACTLMNINSVWHPTITYGRYRNWDGTTPFKEQPLFYQGADEYTGNKLNLVSNEVLCIKAELLKRYPKLDLVGIRHVRDWFLRAYGSDIEDTSSLHRMLQTNKGYRGLLHPMIQVKDHDGGIEYLPNFKYRYMTEDIPCGLVVTRGIAELVGVETPHIDEILWWSQKQSGKEYLVDNKLCGKDLQGTRCPQRYGQNTLDEFMKANRYE